MKNNDKLKFIKNFYDGLNDEQFRERLERAGFDIVDDKSGRVFSDDEIVDDE